MPLDIGIGILISFFIGNVFSVPVGWDLLLFGVLFSLLPDMDILPFLWPTTYNHRSFFHYPLLYVPLASGVYLLCGAVWGTLFSFCILAHFIHDTIGIGWGIAWLAPFSPRKFLFPEKGRRQRNGFFMTWLPEEEKEMLQGPRNPHWIRAFYLRPNPIAYVEYGVLVLSLALVAYFFSYHF